jgi:hypothetical protein
MGRPGLLGLGLAAAIGLPYVTSPDSGLRKWANSVAEKPAATRTAATAGLSAAGSAPTASHPVTRPEGQPVTHLGEVFRFDVTTGWVLARWPRVTTRLATLDLQGYRVALVTGTKESDLAGSLTYYFNPDQRVQRIAFKGTTGDTRMLVALLSSQFGFVRTATPDPHLHLYQVKEDREVVSELRIHSISTIKSTDPHGRFQVALVIERPSES